MSYLRYAEQQIIHMTCAESGLRKEEEQKLVRRAKRGDRAALDSLIKANLNLPRAFAHHRAMMNKDFMEADLYAEAFWGLYAAFRKFDVKRDVRFATYAMNWVKVYVDRFIERQGAVVRTHKSGAGTGSIYHFMSLNETVHSVEGEEDGLTHIDRLLDDGPSPEDQAVSASEGRNLLAILEHTELTKMERDIIQHRYLREDMIYEDLGAMHGVSRERVRQVDARLRGRLGRILERNGYGVDDAE